MQVSLIFGKTFLREVISKEIDRKTTPQKAGLLYRLALAAIECWSNPSDGFWAWLTLLSYYWKRQRILWKSQFWTNNLWMFHCDEDYLSSIGGIEHHLVLNHLGGFPRMASQTRWVNTNSWENSLIFILPQSMYHLGYWELFGWYTPDKKDQHLPISEGRRALKLMLMMLILVLESVESWCQNLWIQLKLSSNISCGHPCKKM